MKMDITLDENDAFAEDALWIYDGNFDLGYQSRTFELKMVILLLH